MSLKATLSSFALILLAYEAYACDTPYIFTYGDPLTCTNMQVSLQGTAGDGTKWSSSNVTFDDLPTLKNLYQNPEIMVHFGNGQPIQDADINARIELWTKRAASGHPHGTWIIRSQENSTPMGLMATGAHMDPGTCELSRMLLLDFQKLRLGSSVMDALVKVWAPAARAQGLQTQNPLMAEKFRCFRNEPLKTLYVSSSPSNVASWKSQIRAGFRAKKVLPEVEALNFKPAQEMSFVDLTVDWVETYTQIEEALHERFTNTSETFKPDILYAMIDPQGDLRTFSLSSKYNKIKYHFTYAVPDPQ